MTAITLSGVSKRFDAVQALYNIDLGIEKGEFVSLIGPSGCGKTTLLRIMAGLVKPSEGKVLIKNEPPKVACSNQEIGLAFQRPALIPSLTALQNVQLTTKLTRHNHCLSAKDLLTEFGLGNFIDCYPDQLSGGMQQRVNIACALVHRPEYLFLDEPFGALDEITRENLGIWLESILIESPKTVVFVTHNIEEAIVLSDRVIIMSVNPGEIFEEIKINLPRPRGRTTRTEDSFLETLRHARTSLYKTMNGGNHE